MARLHMTLDHEVDVLEHQFARNAVQTFTGTARFLDPNRIEVTSEVGRGTTFTLNFPVASVSIDSRASELGA